MWAGWMMMADDCRKRNLLAKQLLCSKKPLWDGAWSGLIHWWGKTSQIKRQFMLGDSIPCSYPTLWTQVAFSMQEPSPTLTDTNGPSGNGTHPQIPRGNLQQSQALCWGCHPSPGCGQQGQGGLGAQQWGVGAQIIEASSKTQQCLQLRTTTSRVWLSPCFYKAIPGTGEMVQFHKMGIFYRRFWSNN